MKQKFTDISSNLEQLDQKISSLVHQTFDAFDGNTLVSVSFTIT